MYKQYTEFHCSSSSAGDFAMANVYNQAIEYIQV